MIKKRKEAQKKTWLKAEEAGQIQVNLVSMSEVCRQSN
jgi:ribosomal protein S9